MVAQIRGGSGSDTKTWWLRYGGVVAQIGGGALVAQIREGGGSDTEKCWLRYGDVVVQMWGLSVLDTGCGGSNRGYSMVTQITGSITGQGV